MSKTTTPDDRQPTPQHGQGATHPDFDGHAERPFAEWPATEKWRWAAGLERLRRRVTIKPSDGPVADHPEENEPDSKPAD